MKYFLLFIICSTLLSSKQKQPTTGIPSRTNDTKDSLTSELRELHYKGEINGYSVAIVNEDKVIYKNSFGFADVADQSPYSTNTVQNIASISKTLIGIALLKAQELGKLSLDDPISKFLDFNVRNPNFSAEDITIRQLATHTSSIIDGDIYDEKSYIFEVTNR